MMPFKNMLFFFAVFFLSYRKVIVLCESELGIFDEILENIRISLRNVSMPHADFDTQKQEFGRFKCTLDNIEITGLDKFEIITFSMTIFPLGVKNMTLRIPRFLVRGNYNLDGTLIFPIGNKPLHVFGNGGMTINFDESFSCTKVIIGSKGGGKVLKELDLGFNITTMNVKMENLMGGGLLEDIFNEYFSEIGPTIYNYYKPILMEEVKKPLADVINKLLKAQ